MKLSPVIWLALMAGVFYFLLIRPQRRQMMAHRELMASLAAGDEVMTMGGIFGRILSLEDEVVELEVAPGTMLRVARSAVARKV